MADTILSVLNPISTRDVASLNLLNRLTALSNQTLSTAQQSISTDYGAQINSVNRDTTKWSSIELDLKEASQFLADIARRIQNIDGYAQKMLSQTVLAQNGDEISDLGYEAAFNSYLRSWLTEANDRGGTPNLIGSTTQSDYRYYIDIYGAYQTVSRYDLTTGYYIIDSGGYTWQRDPDTTSLIQQVDSTTGAETGTYAGIAGGIRLDSLVGDTVTFSILPDTAGETQYTGTLYRTGLGVLDAWLYDGLTTGSGRTTAQDDIDAARATIKAQLARFNAASATADYYTNLAENNVQGLSSRIDSLTTAMALKLQEAQDKAGRQAATNVLIVNQAQAIRDEYLKAFALGSSNDGLTQALIDIIA